MLSVAGNRPSLNTSCHVREGEDEDGEGKEFTLIPSQQLVTGPEAAPQTWPGKKGAPSVRTQARPVRLQLGTGSPHGKTHFADLNGTGGPWETRQTGLKG